MIKQTRSINTMRRQIRVTHMVNRVSVKYSYQRLQIFHNSRPTFKRGTRVNKVSTKQTNHPESTSIQPLPIGYPMIVLLDMEPANGDDAV